MTATPLVAHRGYPARYPENTLQGLAAAVETGARFLEFDIQLTRDRVPVLCHDASLRRTAGLDKLVMDLSIDELLAVDVGEAGRFGDRHRGTHVTTLQAFVDWFSGQPRVTAFVEIKRQSLERFGTAATVERILETLRPVSHGCVIISFDSPCLHAAREQGAAAVGWAIRDAGAHTQSEASKLDPEYLFCGDELFPAAQAAITGSWRWIVYETSDPEHARRLIAQGATLVETDSIGEMQAAFCQGAGWNTTAT